MLYDLVHTILGELPQNLEFLYAFGYVLVLYFVAKIFTSIVNVIQDFLRSL